MTVFGTSVDTIRGFTNSIKVKDSLIAFFTDQFWLSNRQSTAEDKKAPQWREI